MMETISPAVCGTRIRTVAALAAFAAGAFAAALAVGAALAHVRGLMPDVVLVPLALAAALLVLRTRRQVPERWHRALPLPVWASGYGAGLGAGVLTYQPSLAFVSMALAVIALHSTPLGLLAFSGFAVGRVAMAALPAAAVDVLPRFYRPMRRLGYVAALVLLVALGAAPAHAATVARIDPSVAPNGTLAYTQRAADGTTAVVVQPADGSAAHVFAGGAWPALDGDRLAYADAAGIVVVRWGTGEQVAHLDGRLSKPALAWPILIAVQTTAGGKRLIAHDLTSGAEHVLDHTTAAFDLGRPSTDGASVVWHVTTNHISRLRLAHIGVFRTRTILHSRVRLFANPSIRGARLVYVVQRHGHSALYTQAVGGHRTRQLLLVRSPLLLWTTATNGVRAYTTLWNTDTGTATIRQFAE